MPTTEELLGQLRGNQQAQAPNSTDLLSQLRREQPQPPAGINLQPLLSSFRNQREVQQLQRQLGGRLPTQGALPQFTQPFGGTFGGAAIGSQQIRQREIQRRDAFRKLLNLGFSSEEISGALAFEQAIKPPSRLPQTAGALAGTLALGRFIPGPIDDIAIGARLLRGGAQAAAAGAGGIAGKALQVAADPDEEFNFNELAKVFGEEAAFEAVTLGLAPIGKKIIGGARRTAIAGGERLSKRLTEAGRRMGIKSRFLPAQFSDNQLIDTLQGIGENSLVGSNAVFQFKRGQVAIATDMIEGLSETISRGAKDRSLDEMASLVIDAVEDKGLMHGVVASKLFGAVDVASAGAKVDMRPVKALANKITTRAAKAGNIGQTETSLGMLKRLTDDIDDFASFETGQDVRSGLLDILRKGESKLTPDPKAVGIVKRITPEVDAAMGQAARNAGPEVEPLWRRANLFWKAGKKRFNNKMISKLMKDLPDRPEVITKIFKPNAKTSLLRVKKAVGPKTFQELKGTYIEHIVRNSSKIDPSAISGIGESVGDKILRQFNNLGEDTIKATFTAKETQAIRDSARTLGIIQGKTGGQAGALRFVQGTALAGIIAAPFLPSEKAGRAVSVSSGVLLLGPAVLGKLMTKPGFAKLLSEGFKATPGTQKAVALSARLARNVFKARREINQERRKRQIQRENEQRILTGKIPEPRLLGGFKR